MSIAPAGWGHIKVTSGLFGIAIVTVILRFIARRRARLDFGADDWTLLVALALVFLVYVEGLICKHWTRMSPSRRNSLTHSSASGVVHGGIGKHLAQLTPSELTILLKCYLSCWLTYGSAFIITKISVLLLYRRVFPVYRFRIICYLVGFLVFTLGISILMVGFFQCRPFNYIWNKTIPGGVCLPTTPVF
ncbi:MAG: hypothetical protein Q9200_005356 [Gallowayella weberi]